MTKREHINKEELLDLLKKYNIGKKPLSKLLGWGETTVLLYCLMDDIPYNEYSERLYELYTNKSQYLDLLIKNQNNITGVAFRKSLLAIHKPLLESRILFISQYIFDNSKSTLTEAHLNVILLCSLILSLKFLDKPLFSDPYQPSKGSGNSPYKVVTEAYRNRMFFYFPEDKDVEEMRKNLSLTGKNGTGITLLDSEKEVIDHVIEIFSWYGEKAFNKLLASERFRLCGPSSSRNRRSVSVETMRKVYLDVLDQAKVRKLGDIDTYIAKRIEALRKKIIDSEE